MILAPHKRLGLLPRVKIHTSSYLFRQSLHQFDDLSLWQTAEKRIPLTQPGFESSIQFFRLIHCLGGADHPPSFPIIPGGLYNVTRHG